MLFLAGYDFSACHVAIWNIASINVIEKCGFKKKFFVRFLRILGLGFTTRNVYEMLKKNVQNINNKFI